MIYLTNTMMKLKYYTLLLCALSLGACNKVEVVQPNFTVVADKTTAKVGEEITFNFSGDPDQISFYSGEALKDYAFKDGRLLVAEGLQLSFTTTVQYGTQSNQFSVLFSTDFNGDYSMDGIRKATWTNMTADYNLATTTTQVTWGPKELKSMIVNGKPVYIAFRYLTPSQVINGTHRTWSVRLFSLKGSSAVGVLNVADQVSAGFTMIHDGPQEPGRASSTATTITLRGNIVDTQSPTEDWAITKPIDVGEVDLGPDKPQPIKGFVDTRSSEFKYTYTKAGDYKVVFVASNANIYGSQQVVKELNVTITP